MRRWAKALENMNKDEQIVSLFLKKFEGTLTTEEAQMLDSWVSEPENAQEYEKYQLLWDTSSSLSTKQDSFTPNSSKSWDTIEQHIVADKPKRKFKLVYAAAASIALICMLFGANYFFNSADGSIQLVLNANQNDTLTFSDGSQAYVFGPCTISYPENFDAAKRIISMDGFAYFDIAHDANRSFEIITDKGMVEVLGTSFTVDTRDQETFTVQCITGKVRVTGGSESQQANAILTRSKKATYTKQLNQIAVTSFDLEDAGFLIPAKELSFDNESLASILEHIEYSYDVNIEVENKELLATKYSTTIYDSTIGDFLKELEITYNVKVVQTASANYILKGGNSN